MNVELIREPQDWTSDHKEIARLMRYLIECGDLKTPEDCAYFVEKVKRGGFEQAYEQMLRDEAEDRLLEEAADDLDRRGAL